MAYESARKDNGSGQVIYLAMPAVLYCLHGAAHDKCIMAACGASSRCAHRKRSTPAAASTTGALLKQWVSRTCQGPHAMLCHSSDGLILHVCACLQQCCAQSRSCLVLPALFLLLHCSMPLHLQLLSCPADHGCRLSGNLIQMALSCAVVAAFNIPACRSARRG